MPRADDFADVLCRSLMSDTMHSQSIRSEGVVVKRGAIGSPPAVVKRRG